MLHIYIDVETYSEQELTKTGVYRYAHDSSTKLLLLAYAIDNGETRIWDSRTGETLPDIFNSNVARYVAHNAEFERIILRDVCGIDIPASNWVCTETLARAQNLPASLEKCAEALKLSDKKIENSRFMSLFTKPTRYVERDGEWNDFIEYCKRDVEICRTIHKSLPALSDYMQICYEAAAHGNDVGIPVNTTFVHNAIVSSQRALSNVHNEMRELTGVQNPNSVVQLKKWLSDNGWETSSLRAEMVSAFVTDETLSEPVRKLLNLRLRASKTSIKKYEALAASAVNGRVYGTLKYLGASRTGRDAGRLFQPQNLPRGTLSDEETTFLTAKLNNSPVSASLDELSSVVRSAIQAPAGKKLVICDYSSIEMRVGGWISKCRRLQSAFNRGLDVYKDFASRLYSVDYEKVAKNQRSVAKVVMLGCMYGMGVGKLTSYLASAGIFLEDADTERYIKNFRATYPEISAMYTKLERGLGSSQTGDGSGKIQLPSGRFLVYQRLLKAYDCISFTNARGLEESTWGGKLFENVVQAISADILYAGYIRAIRAGIKIVLRVHDELVAEIDENDSPELLEKAMTAPLRWASDLRVPVETTESVFYKK